MLMMRQIMRNLCRSDVLATFDGFLGFQRSSCHKVDPKWGGNCADDARASYGASSAQFGLDLA